MFMFKSVREGHAKITFILVIWFTYDKATQATLVFGIRCLIGTDEVVDSLWFQHN